MRKIFSLAIACGMALLSLASCSDKVDKNLVWPQWASRPVIEDAEISAGGRQSVTAGESVKLHARIHDDFCELKEYSILVKFAGNTVIDNTVNVSGNEVVIDMDLTMPFSPLMESGYPEVSISAANADNGTAAVRLANDRNVSVLRPAAPEKLYLVGTNGRYVALDKSDVNKYLYTTASADLIASVGESFYVAEKVKGNAPDFSGFVWGMADSGAAVVIADGGKPLKMPDSSGMGFKQLGFDIYTFKVDKMINHTVVVDRSKMTEMEQSGVHYLAMERAGLMRDCEVVFEGFGELGSMLQADRFDIIDSKTAKFTGHTTNWNIYYDVDDNWMIVDYSVSNTTEQIWVTGQRACFPLGGDGSAHELKYLDGDGKVRFATLAAVKDEDGVYSCLLYLKADYVIQLYRWIKWSTTVSMTSLTPETAKITDDKIFIRPGSKFTPGVYLLEIAVTTEADAWGDGSKAEISVKPYNL